MVTYLFEVNLVYRSVVNFILYYSGTHNLDRKLETTRLRSNYVIDL